MIHPILIAVALMSQVPDGDVFPVPTSQRTYAEDARLDLGFAFAVEDSILREPGTRVPWPYRNLIAMLGCESYRGREDASTRLESAIRKDPAALRWAFWGRRHRDPEVKHRSNCIVRRMAPKCPSCRGSGRSKHEPKWPCLDCNAAPIWTLTPWD